MQRSTADKVLARAAKMYAGTRISIIPGGYALPKETLILAPNHPTTLDPVLLRMAVDRPFSALLTESAFGLPLVGAVLRAGEHLPVGEDPRSRATLVGAATGTLLAGRSMAVFPEGSLSPDQGLAPLHTGTVRLAAITGAPVVPVGIATSSAHIKAISRRYKGGVETGKYLLSGWYVVRFGEALRFGADPQDRGAMQAGTELLREAMGRVQAEARYILDLLEGRAETVGISRQGTPVFAPFS